MSIQALLLAALMGGILRLIVLPRGKWCTKKAAVLSGRSSRSIAYTCAILLFVLQTVLIAGLSQWQPVGFESQAVQAFCAAFLGWHLSANLVNAITSATLTESELKALRESQSRLRTLLERLPAEEIRLRGDQLVLFPLLALPTKEARPFTETEIIQLKKEQDWFRAVPEGFDLHYQCGIVRVQFGPLASFDWQESGGSTRSCTVKEEIRREFEGLSEACELLEQRFPEYAVPLQGPPRFRLTGV